MAQGKRVEIRLGPEQIAAVDNWRRHLADLPPRAEAIVRLMEIGLETVAKKRTRPEPKK